MLAPSDDLLDLLVQWEERRSSGAPAAPEDLCRTRPELLAPLTELVRRVRRLDALVLAHDQPTPLAVPGYEIQDEVGRGGMGAVYRARDLKLDRLVAIKCPHASGVSTARFEREMRFLASLGEHPNIVPVYSAGTADGRPYFVMGYVTGGNLAGHADALRGHPDRIAAVLEQVARAAEYAHRAHVLHRDLKPSNILMTTDGRPLVSDFGVAALLAGEAAVGDDERAPHPNSRVTRTGALVGTPAYSAPEAFRGAPGVLTPTSDVWSLGVILYEVLTGRLPFQGTGPELGERITCSAPPGPRAVRPDVPRGLESITLKCLARNPLDRFQSAGELAEALARWRRRHARANSTRRLCAVLMLTLALGSALAVVLRPSDPVARHAAHSASLAAQVQGGNVVELVGEVGAPRTHRVRLGREYARTGVCPDGTFTVAAARQSLIELIADPGVDRFRLSAEVRENGFLGDAAFGVYFAHEEFDHPDGPAHVFAVVQFSDYGPLAVQYLPPGSPPGTAPQSLCELSHRCIDDPVLTAKDYANRTGPTRPYPPPDPTAPLPGPWRLIEIEATPGSTRATFAGLALKEYPNGLSQPWADLLPQKRARLSERKVRIGSRGGIGLYVSGGEASVRNVRLQPLAP